MEDGDVTFAVTRPWRNFVVSGPRRDIRRRDGSCVKPADGGVGGESW